MTAKTYPCQLCGGSGRVSPEIHGKKVDLRDRARFNARMKKVNKAARDRKRAESVKVP